jgi:hypothetical protein
LFPSSSISFSMYGTCMPLNIIILLLSEFYEWLLDFHQICPRPEWASTLNLYLYLSHNLNVDTQGLVLWHFCIIIYLFQVQGLGPVLPILAPLNFVQPFVPWSYSFTIPNHFIIPHIFCWASLTYDLSSLFCEGHLFKDALCFTFSSYSFIWIFTQNL